MSQHFALDAPVKVQFKDLQRLGIVRSRFHLHKLIKGGTLRAPHKDAPGGMQSRAWWYWQDIQDDLERERAALEQQAAE